MSKARAQSSKRRTMRTMYGASNPDVNSTKRPGKRLQVIRLGPPKKKGRKSNRRKWLEKLPMHLGASKFIYHNIGVELKMEEN